MKLIPNTVTRTIFRKALVLRKNSPSILFASGIVGTLGSTALACRATLKLSDKLPEMKHDLDKARHQKGQEAEGKSVARVYAQNLAVVAKLYAPAAVVGTASIASLTGSHVTLRRRNVGLTAAYAAVSEAYEEYRERVKKELGDDKELDIYHAVSVETVTTLDGNTGDARVADDNRWSPYARFFDESNPNWQKSPEYNRFFLKAQQNYANDLLQARGHLFLNEVYTALGFDHTKQGSVVGWVIGKKAEGHKGDNFVDFGIFDVGNRRFVNNYERTPLLDFNVDGVIFDLI